MIITRCIIKYAESIVSRETGSCSLPMAFPALASWPHSTPTFTVDGNLTEFGTQKLIWLHAWLLLQIWDTSIKCGEITASVWCSITYRNRHLRYRKWGGTVFARFVFGRIWREPGQTCTRLSGFQSHLGSPANLGRIPQMLEPRASL